jgi:hypothetical protein
VARIGIFSLIFLTLAIRLRSIEHRDAMIASFDIGSAIKELAKENGLDAQENSTNLVPGAIYFKRPECPAPSIILPFDLNFEALPPLSRIAPLPSYTYIFLYLDGSWATQNRASIFATRLKHSVLGLFGASRFLPVRQAIVLAEPNGCPGSARFDWQLIWDRNWNYVQIEQSRSKRQQ